MKILGIIPARGGSKGVVNKNIRDVAGKPLLQYTIDTAEELLANGCLDACVLSTDSQLIIDSCSCMSRVEAPFLRPKSLATDTAKTIDVVLHALGYFESLAQIYDAICILQPTCPLRTASRLRHGFEVFKKSAVDSLISCYAEEYVCDSVSYSLTSRHCLSPFVADHANGKRRQDHQGRWVRNGSIYLTKADYLKRHRRIICDSPLLLEMSKTESVNIDVEEDLVIAEALIVYSRGKRERCQK